MSQSPADPRTRVLALLRRHGWNATSFQVLEPSFRYHFVDDQACVAYVDTGGAWVAAGAPITTADRLAEVAERFVAAAARAGKRAAFFAIESRFSRVAPVGVLQVGEQPVWDPARWPDVLLGTRSLREQLRRARAKGVVVRQVAAGEIGSPDSPVRRAVDALAARWLQARSLAPMGFLVDLELFAFPEERRTFVAEQDGRLVGVLVAVPVYSRAGWLFEDLLREPDAPNGTAELLIDTAMRAVAGEGSRYVTLGLAPLAGFVDRRLRFVRRASRALFDFEGLRAFKAKLRPSRWEPIYLAYPEAASPTRALADVLLAFARGSFTRFGVTSILRGPAVVVRALAALLVPWTVALALVNPDRWFPSLLVRDAWVAFDAVLVVCLFALAARFRRRLAVLLATLVTGDAMATMLQALAFDVPRVRGVLDAVVIVVACLAPILASTILWSAVGHRVRPTGLARAFTPEQG